MSTKEQYLSGMDRFASEWVKENKGWFGFNEDRLIVDAFLREFCSQAPTKLSESDLCDALGYLIMEAKDQANTDVEL